jgi:hypothetical protein
MSSRSIITIVVSSQLPSQIIRNAAAGGPTHAGTHDLTAVMSG